jgi:hypothetical protein
MAAQSTLLGALIVTLAATLAAQQAPTRDRTPPAAAAPTTGTASLSGAVFNDTTGRPLRRATVAL